MSPKTPAQRQAERKARQLAAGLMRWSAWVHRGDAQAMTAAAARLAAKRVKTARQK